MCNLNESIGEDKTVRHWLMSNKKRGIMGIGTLIIFIATILVAAVAAAVLISTSNVLQQRSLLVGQEARKAITDGINVFSITSESNATNETFNNFEILVRLSPGSDALQMKKFDIEFLANRIHGSATLDFEAGQNAYEQGAITGTNYTGIGADLDGDGQNDYVRIIDDGSSDYLNFNLTDAGISDNISLGAVDGSSLTLEETAVAIGEDIYGTVQISDSGSGSANELSANATTVRKYASECEFDTLPPEDHFCYQVLVGNDDTVLDSREKFRILYKLKHENALTVGDDLLFIFSSEKGRLTETRARTPDVITLTKTRIWPLG